MKKLILSICSLLFFTQTNIFTNTNETVQTTDDIFHKLFSLQEQIKKNLFDNQSFDNHFDIIGQESSKLPEFSIEEKNKLVIIKINIPDIEQDIVFKKDPSKNVHTATITYNNGTLHIVISEKNILLSHSIDSKERAEQDEQAFEKIEKSMQQQSQSFSHHINLAKGDLSYDNKTGLLTIEFPILEKKPKTKTVKAVWQ